MVREVLYATLTIMFLLQSGCSWGIGLPEAKISIKVIDEEGKPVENADVKIGFEKNAQQGSKYNNVEGITKADGKYAASGSCNTHVGFTVTKSGYYESGGTYDFKNKSAFRWEPWNPEIVLVLIKIENPVSMYARDATLRALEIPVAGKDVGFDLISYDWVGPYGHGTFSDLVFNLIVIDNGGDDFEYQLKLKFPEKFDGIQSFEINKNNNSVFLLSRIAPDDGYKKEINVYLKGLKRGAKMSWKDDRHYIFRIRSEVKNGKLKRAMYGKILSDIAIANPKKAGKLPQIKFKYYLNPNYTRNLEFDPKQNLFKNLDSREQVGIE